jgi:hypothetical protein
MARLKLDPARFEVLEVGGFADGDGGPAIEGV